MTVPHRANTLDVRVKTITPRQPKSFRNIIEEARQRIAEGLDIDAQEAVESSNHQRSQAPRFNQGE